MCHVLIIEDELLIADYIQMVIEASGATSVEIVETEFEAVRAAMKHRPGVITSDLSLKEGNGLKAVEAIRDQAGPIPVIFITSTPELRAKKGAYVCVLGKPADEAMITHQSAARAASQASFSTPCP